MTKPIQDDKGRFVKGAPSPNPSGRPKHSKNKVSKNKLDNLLLKAGPDAIDQIMTIMKEAALAKDWHLAMKAGVWIGDKYYQLVLHNEKLELAQVQKDKPSAEDEEDEQDNTLAPVVFAPFAQKEA